MVFIDGCATGLLITDPGANPIRATIDKEFKDILLRIANSTPVSQQLDTTYGTKYVIKAEMPASSGKIYTIVTIWIIEKNEENPKFVTAYPATK